MWTICVVLILLTVESYSEDFTALVPELDGRITGGSASNISKHPHQMSLQYRGLHTCSASLVSQTKLLTAAHCVDRLDVSELSVTHTLSHHDRSTQAVAEVRQHPRYNPHTLNNDVAVLVLASPVAYSRILSQTALAAQVPHFDDELVASGWGRSVNNIERTEPSHLQSVKVKIVAHARCRDLYNSTGTVTNSMVCAQPRWRAACFGEGGGALFDTEHNILVGVASWGWGCARPGWPSVYTSIPHLLKEILAL